MAPRRVNSLLGARPNLGPFPADQVFPWAVITLIGVGLHSFLAVDGTVCAVFVLWGISTYWLLTGKRAWRFFSRFVRTPFWIRGHAHYSSPLDVTPRQSKTR